MCILTPPPLHLLEFIVLKQLTYVMLAQVQELPGQFVALATCFLEFGHREEQTIIQTGSSTPEHSCWGNSETWAYYPRYPRESNWLINTLASKYPLSSHPQALKVGYLLDTSTVLVQSLDSRWHQRNECTDMEMKVKIPVRRHFLQLLQLQSRLTSPQRKDCYLVNSTQISVMKYKLQVPVPGIQFSEWHRSA